MTEFTAVGALTDMAIWSRSPFIAIVLFAAIIASTISAAEVSVKDAQGLVAVASGGRARALAVFQGPRGLTGVLIDSGGHQTVGWTQDGSLLFLGPLFDRQGQDDTALATEKLGLFAAQNQPADVYASADKLAGIIVGNSGPTAIAFIDANCVFCRRFYQSVMPYVDQGKLRVKFVPVAILKASSLGRGAALLVAKDGADALRQDADDFDEAHEEGGIPPATSPAQQAITAIAVNTRFLFGIERTVGTPTLVYKTADGYRVLNQMPGDIPAFVTEIKD